MTAQAIHLATQVIDGRQLRPARHWFCLHKKGAKVLGAISQFLSDNAVALGILSAIVGFVGKHISDRRLRSYEARLGFVRDQLKELYGPLFLLSKANDKAWGEFRRSFRPNEPMFDPAKPLTAAERAEYVRWLEVAFVPCNNKMRTIIERNAHLFVEGRAPATVLDLLAHFDELDVVLSKLKDGADDNVFPAVMYPKEFGPYISKDYEAVVARHATLTAQRQ